MSLTLEQIYTLNPSMTINDTDLFYLVQSPYTPGTDSAITGLSLKNIFVTLPGSTSLTTLGTITTGTWNATTIGTVYGGTGLTSYTLGDMLYASAANTLARLAGNTTSTKNFLSQTGTGVVSAAPVWTTISASDIGSGQALTKTDDTNVTLTLGGTPATSLLKATSLTLGWTGTLSGTRGGTGVNNGANTATFAGNLNFAAAFSTSGAFAVTQTYTGITNVTFPTSGTLATTSQLPTPAALTKVDDTNVTLTLGGTPATALLQATSLTLGWTGQLGLTRGGTAASLVASNGGIVYSNASTLAILSGTATANLPLLSQSSTAPVWGSFALNLGGALTTGGALTLSGAFGATFTFTNTTSVTFPTSGTLATTSQIPTGAALTKTDDTNVTLTLGGSPSTALVNAASLTLGWTGQLSVGRGGTGLSSITAHNLIIGNGTSAATLLAPSATSGVPLISQGSSSDPAYGTAVVAGGGTGATSFTAYAVICGGTTSTGVLQSVVALGAAGTVLTSNGAGALPSFQSVGSGTVTSVATSGLATGGPITTTGTVTVTAASASDQQTGTSTTVAVVPNVQQNHKSALKVWINFNGVTPANNDSFNVSSFARNSTGNFTISFTTSFANTTYSLVGNHSGNASNATGMAVSTLNTGSAVILCDSGGALSNPGTGCVHISGQQ